MLGLLCCLLLCDGPVRVVAVQRQPSVVDSSSRAGRHQSYGSPSFVVAGASGCSATFTAWPTDGWLHVAFSLAVKLVARSKASVLLFF